MPSQELDGPEGVAEVLGHEDLAQELEPDEGHPAGILVPVRLLLPQARAKGVKAGDGDDVAAADQLAAVVVVRALDGRGHAREVLAAVTSVHVSLEIMTSSDLDSRSGIGFLKERKKKTK